MSSSKRIIHSFRAPVGGLFRHVCDLVRAQSEMGHEVGVVCDSATGGEAAEQRLDMLSRTTSLGVKRVAMSRGLGLRDFSASRAVLKFAEECKADVLHGHGAKGGAYARLAASRLQRRGTNILAAYTPHGGSLHYDRDSLSGRLYLGLEQRLAPATDCLIFESEYASRLYEDKVGAFPCPSFIIPNGLWPDEFYNLVLDQNATDFLFIGELRYLKGVDVLLTALAGLRGRRKITATIVGSGPDERQFRKMAESQALKNRVRFLDAMPARLAFPRGACLVVPSRAESFPYIVLEAAAARFPMILTNVGGIPEIVAGTDMELLPPGNASALESQMAAYLANPALFAERAKSLQESVAKRFRASQMAASVCQAYERAGTQNQPD